MYYLFLIKKRLRFQIKSISGLACGLFIFKQRGLRAIFCSKSFMRGKPLSSYSNLFCEQTQQRVSAWSGLRAAVQQQRAFR